MWVGGGLGRLDEKSGGRGCPTELKLMVHVQALCSRSDTPRYLLTGGAADLRASPPAAGPPLVDYGS